MKVSLNYFYRVYAQMLNQRIHFVKEMNAVQNLKDEFSLNTVSRNGHIGLYIDYLKIINDINIGFNIFNIKDL